MFERFKQLMMLGPYAAGCVSGLSFHSLIQDYYGREGYIQHLRESWITESISVPIAIVCIAWAQWSYARFYWERRES